MRNVFLLLVTVACVFAGEPVSGTAQTSDTAALQTLRSQSTLVLVPALVSTKAGEFVYTLTEKDFVLTDDGIEQKLRLEEDTGGQPLALVVLIQAGGVGRDQLPKYARLEPMIEAIVGNVPHTVALVGFDSQPETVQNFTPDVEKVGSAIAELGAGNGGAAILDAVGFSVDLLRKQPKEFRRAIVLISETVDHGSRLKLEEALRAVSDTNTAVYSLGFSSSRSDLSHESGEMFQPDQPGPPGGCMAKDPSLDPRDAKSKGEQAFDCLSLLAPPLRLAKAAAMIAINQLRKNVPETVARLTGGEYFKFENVKGLERGMRSISNHLPNRYLLSFQPQAPHEGSHVLELKLKDYSGLVVHARTSYWVDGSAMPKP